MYKYSQPINAQYHGPLPVRNFFPLPNAIFDLGLTAEEIAVYAFLMKCEDEPTPVIQATKRLAEQSGKAKTPSSST